MIENISKWVAFALLLASSVNCGRRDGLHRGIGEAGPPPGSLGGPVAYKEVQPILNKRCTPCHNFASSYQAIFPLARSGKTSLVYRYVVERSPKEMPPPNTPQARSMTSEERQVLASWAESGAPFTTSPETPGPQGPVPSPARPPVELGGPARLIQQCWTCHGEFGISSLGQRPNLAGMSKEYLAGQLRSYQKGERMDFTENQMNAIAARLSESDIQFLASYYSELPPPPQGIAEAELSETELKLARASWRLQSCQACHRDGSGVPAPILAGQNELYLRTQIEGFRRGQRRSLAMEMIARDMTKAETELVSRWLALGSPRGNPPQLPTVTEAQTGSDRGMSGL